MNTHDRELRELLRRQRKAPAVRVGPRLGGSPLAQSQAMSTETKSLVDVSLSDAPRVRLLGEYPYRDSVVGKDGIIRPTKEPTETLVGRKKIKLEKIKLPSFGESSRQVKIYYAFADGSFFPMIRTPFEVLRDYTATPLFAATSDNYHGNARRLPIIGTPEFAADKFSPLNTATQLWIELCQTSALEWWESEQQRLRELVDQFIERRLSLESQRYRVQIPHHIRSHSCTRFPKEMAATINELSGTLAQQYVDLGYPDGFIEENGHEVIPTNPGGGKGRVWRGERGFKHSLDDGNFRCDDRIGRYIHCAGAFPPVGQTSVLWKRLHHFELPESQRELPLVNWVIGSVEAELRYLKVQAKRQFLSVIHDESEITVRRGSEYLLNEFEKYQASAEERALINGFVGSADEKIELIKAQRRLNYTHQTLELSRYNYHHRHKGKCDSGCPERPHVENASLHSFREKDSDGNLIPVPSLHRQIFTISTGYPEFRATKAELQKWNKKLLEYDLPQEPRGIGELQLRGFRKNVPDLEMTDEEQESHETAARLSRTQEPSDDDVQDQTDDHADEPVSSVHATFGTNWIHNTTPPQIDHAEVSKFVQEVRAIYNRDDGDRSPERDRDILSQPKFAEDAWQYSVLITGALMQREGENPNTIIKQFERGQKRRARAAELSELGDPEFVEAQHNWWKELPCVPGLPMPIQQMPIHGGWFVAMTFKNKPPILYRLDCAWSWYTGSIPDEAETAFENLHQEMRNEAARQAGYAKGSKSKVARAVRDAKKRIDAVFERVTKFYLMPTFDRVKPDNHSDDQCDTA